MVRVKFDKVGNTLQTDPVMQPCSWEHIQKWANSRACFGREPSAHWRLWSGSGNLLYRQPHALHWPRRPPCWQRSQHLWFIVSGTISYICWLTQSINKNQSSILQFMKKSASFQPQSINKALYKFLYFLYIYIMTSVSVGFQCQNLFMPNIILKQQKT